MSLAIISSVLLSSSTIFMNPFSVFLKKSRSLDVLPLSRGNEGVFYFKSNLYPNVNWNTLFFESKLSIIFVTAKK